MSRGRIRNEMDKKLGPFADWAGKVIRHKFTEADREGKPFSREQINWIKEAAANSGLVVSGFGSTLDIQKEGTVMFANRQFKPEGFKAVHSAPLIIGTSGLVLPYTARSIFNISAMSYGAISSAATETFSRGAAKGGFWANTGEGGLAPYHLAGHNEVFFQIGTAKYGVRDLAGHFMPEKLAEIAALPEVVAIEIKLSQGAKPGKGGILPAIKVTEEIAKIRGIEPFKDSISPPDHAEITSVRTLGNFINYVRDIAGKPVGVKTADISFLQDWCDDIKARGERYAPDFITLDGAEGGTGAAPITLLDNVGMSIREMLPVASGILAKNGLKEQIRLIAAGELVLPADVAWALAAGADFVNSARGFMLAIGCMQTKECHLGTCPKGIATQNPELVKFLRPAEQEDRVPFYQQDIIEAIEDVAHTCAVPSARHLRGSNVKIIQSDGRGKPLDEIYPDLKLIK